LPIQEGCEKGRTPEVLKTRHKRKNRAKKKSGDPVDVKGEEVRKLGRRMTRGWRWKWRWRLP